MSNLLSVVISVISVVSNTNLSPHSLLPSNQQGYCEEEGSLKEPDLRAHRLLVNVFFFSKTQSLFLQPPSFFLKPRHVAHTDARDAKKFMEALSLKTGGDHGSPFSLFLSSGKAAGQLGRWDPHIFLDPRLFDCQD